MIKWIDEDYKQELDFEDLDDFRENFNQFIDNLQENGDSFEIRIKFLKTK